MMNINKHLIHLSFPWRHPPPVCLQFSDNYYRADLIEALTNSLTPAISINNEVRTVDNLNADVRLILEEITRFLNMEKLLPSFRNTITVRLGAECVYMSLYVLQMFFFSMCFSWQLFVSVLQQNNLKCWHTASCC